MAGLAVILTDRNGGRKHMHVGPNHTGEYWCSVIGPEDFPIVGDDGCIDCICAPGSMSAYLPERTAEVLANDTIHYSRDAPRDLTKELPTPEEVLHLAEKFEEKAEDDGTEA